jgi:CAAX prenyl protease-like protein
MKSAEEPLSSTLAGAPLAEQTASGGSDLMPYAVPMFAYVGLTGLEGYLPQWQGQPSPVWYPLGYAAKVVIVGLLAWHYRATWKDFLPAPSLAKLGLGVLTGLFVWGLWIGLDGHYPALPLGSRTAFDPGVMSPGARWAFIFVRMLGLAVLVPLVEELFWRSFLMRWLIDPDIFKVPVGRVTPVAAAVTSVVFALAHPEWLPALLTGLLWAWLLWQTKSLAACLISHATANLALGVFVIASGAWKFW